MKRILNQLFDFGHINKKKRIGPIYLFDLFDDCLFEILKNLTDYEFLQFTSTSKHAQSLSKLKIFNEIYNQYIVIHNNKYKFSKMLWTDLSGFYMHTSFLIIYATTKVLLV